MDGGQGRLSSQDWTVCRAAVRMWSSSPAAACRRGYLSSAYGCSPRSPRAGSSSGPLGVDSRRIVRHQASHWVASSGSGGPTGPRSGGTSGAGSTARPRDSRRSTAYACNVGNRKEAWSWSPNIALGNRFPVPWDRQITLASPPPGHLAGDPGVDDGASSANSPASLIRRACHEARIEDGTQTLH